MKLGFAPSLGLCELIFLNVLKSGDVQLALSLFKSFRQKRLEVPTTPFFKYVAQLREDGKLKEAFDLLKELDVIGVKADVIIYNSIISDLLKQDLDQAKLSLECFRTMLQANISPSDVTFKLFLKHEYCTIFEVLLVLEQEGMSYPSWVLDQALSSWPPAQFETRFNWLKYQRRISAETVEAIEQWKNKADEGSNSGDSNLSLSEITSRIHVLIRQDPKRAAEVLESALKKGFLPNRALCEAFLKKMLSHLGDLETALKFSKMFLERNVHPPCLQLYNSFVLKLAKQEKSKEAVELMEELERMGLQPDIYTYNILIFQFVSEDEPKEAIKYFLRMLKAGVQPDLNSIKPFLFHQDKKVFSLMAHATRESIPPALLQAALEQWPTGKFGKRIKQLEGLNKWRTENGGKISEEDSV
eukprot:TRINITY_DN3657_c0_g1_i1.p1 TRINITY_DN3657_c0_g1~~TRINITY_DN3657_c0_g1_i1.p1  ORF type:complete len:414 (+),score=114.39 TRINITY_DN3657_c0_g1_i1:995-2236(+)